MRRGRGEGKLARLAAAMRNCAANRCDSEEARSAMASEQNSERKTREDRGREFALSVWQKDACAPLVVAGPQLHAVRAMLLRRAQELGHRMTQEPALHVLADGAAIEPEMVEGRYRFHLPEGAQDIRLVSRSGVPAHMTADGTDYRTLGVAVTRIVADGHEVPLRDQRRLRSGWHEPEERWCWTDGNAQLAIPGARVLEITVAMTAKYWGQAGTEPAEPVETPE
jgi:hypothetical protein